MADGTLAPRWWESAAAIVRVGAKEKGRRQFPLDEASVTRALDDPEGLGLQRDRGVRPRPRRRQL